MDKSRKVHKRELVLSKFFSKRRKKWFTALLLLYTFTILFLLPVFYQLQKPETKIDQGLKEKKALLLKNPNDPELLTKIAWDYFEMGRLADAESTIEKALKIDDTYIGANYLNGLVKTDLHKFKAAKKSFKTVIDSGEGTKEAMLLAFYGLGLMYKQEEDYLQSIKFLNLAIEQKANNANIHLELGSVYWKLGNDRLAEAAFYKATTLDPVLIPQVEKIKKGK